MSSSRKVQIPTEGWHLVRDAYFGRNHRFTPSRHLLQREYFRSFSVRYGTEGDVDQRKLLPFSRLQRATRRYLQYSHFDRNILLSQPGPGIDFFPSMSFAVAFHVDFFRQATVLFCLGPVSVALDNTIFIVVRSVFCFCFCLISALIFRLTPLCFLVSWLLLAYLHLCRLLMASNFIALTDRWSGLQAQMHRLLERESQILSHHLRWIGRLQQVPLLGKNVLRDW